MALPKIKTIAYGAPFRGGAAVTPSDGADLPEIGIVYVGVSGHVAVITEDGSDIIFKNHPVGYLPGLVKRVKATGTTATDMLALY
jgi:hypothetical protein